MGLVFRRYEAKVDTSALANQALSKFGASTEPYQSAGFNLPIPNNLTEEFNVAYNKEDRTAHKLFAEILGKVSSRLSSGNWTQEKVIEALRDTAASYINDIDTASALPFLYANLGQHPEFGLDYVFNPSMSNIFEGVEPRSFNFSWRVYPESRDEAQGYMDLINTIKYRILPPEAGNFGPFKIVRYPDVVDVFIFGGGEVIFPVITSVVTNFSVDYGASGTPTFFDDNKPTSIQFTLSIREAHSLTRKDFEEKGLSTFGGRFA